jgi:hypothetical protein
MRGRSAQSRLQLAFPKAGSSEPANASQDSISAATLRTEARNSGSV